ncbi:MAG: hypothetical protein JJU11_04400 [Candidatus Sumerlaeia bacterium]|nr:hypothetical protein [Candidatus Sumerlaeia bacterium]
MKIAALNRAIFLKDSDRASRLFDEIQSVEDGFTLRDPVQYQLADLLEEGQFPRQALKAYELALEAYGQQKPRPQALLAAGRISSRLEMTEKAFFHLERYLEVGGTEDGEKEARSLISDLRKPTLSADNLFASSNDIDPSTEKLNVGDLSDGENNPIGSPGNPIHLEDTNASMIQLGGLDDEKSSFKVPEEFKSSGPQPAPPKKDFGPIRPKRPGKPTPPPVTHEPPGQVFQQPPPGPATPDTAFPIDHSPSNAPHRQPRELPPDIGVPADMGAQEPAPPTPPSPPPAPPRERITHDTPKPQWDEFDAPDPAPGKVSENPDERYRRMLDGEFALLLPLGKKIKLDAVAEMIATEQGIDINLARKLVMRRKGLIYSDLPLAEAVSLRDQVAKCDQGLLLVHIAKSIKPAGRLNVRAVEFRDKGLRLETNEGLKRLRWSDVKLVSSGLLGNTTTMTLIGQNPMVEYEFNGAEFRFGLFQEEELGDRIGLAGLIKRVHNNAPDAVISSVSQKLLEKMSRTPQVFATREEYTAYTQYFLYHHFGEVVDMDELWESHQDSSDW